MPRETKEQKKARAKKIFSKLQKMYPDAHCALDFTSPFELLVATILSAQCTDARVNIVMRSFRPQFPDPSSLAKAELPEIESAAGSGGPFRVIRVNCGAMALRNSGWTS